MLFKFINLFKFVWYHPLNDGNRLAAIWRVISWQLASKIIPGPIALPFVNETYLLTTRGMNASTGNRYVDYKNMKT